MIFGGILIVSAIAVFINTEKCERNPLECKNGFMTEQGWTRSPFALRYLGRPKDARNAMDNDEKLRRKHIIYSYTLSAIFLLAGLYAVVTDITL